MNPMRMNIVAAAAAFAFAGVFSAAARAEIKTQTFDYKDGDTTLEGFIAYDDAKTTKQPGIVVFPQWTGPSDHERGAAVDLAKLGYVAMVADPYGKGIRPPQPKLSGIEMGKYMSNRPLLRSRVKAAYDRLLQDSHVDSTRMATIGYCFGGAAVLELGRMGADLKALVTFHGALSNPTPEDAKKITGPVLVLHGADDPAVPPPEVDAFKAEMKAAAKDLQFVAYSDTKHGFTMVSSGTDKSQGSFYNPVSAKRSWAAMKDFLEETIGH